MKRCIKCNIEKNDFEFKSQKTQYGITLHSYCKECHKIYARELARKKGVRPKKRMLISIPDFKICSHCNTEKHKEEFRIRIDNRSNPPFTYLNKVCKLCDAAIHRKYINEKRSTPEGREKHNKDSRERWKKYKEKIKKYEKERRSTKEYQESRKAYIQKNKEKIYQQERITKKRYHEKNRDNITDEYAINLLKNKGVQVTDENIQIQKVKILIHRINEKVNSTYIDERKGCKICGEIKALGEFKKTGKLLEKRSFICKKCESNLRKQYKKRVNEEHNDTAKSSIRPA